MVLLALALLGACGGDGPHGPASVTITWNANRETSVNAPGGGYEVMVEGRAPVDVPYLAGVNAPTSATLTLDPGTYIVTVRAYGTLDPAGGNTRNFSALQTLTFNVR